MPYLISPCNPATRFPKTERTPSLSSFSVMERSARLVARKSCRVASAVGKVVSRNWRAVGCVSSSVIASASAAFVADFKVT